MSAPLKHMEIAPFYWFDGELRPKDEVAVHPFAHALHYGSGVFEGIRAYATPRGPAIFRLREHMERFLRSAAVYSLAVPYDVATLCEATIETVRRNEVESAYIRPLAVFRREDDFVGAELLLSDARTDRSARARRLLRRGPAKRDPRHAFAVAQVLVEGAAFDRQGDGPLCKLGARNAGRLRSRFRRGAPPQRPGRSRRGHR